jgi:hypothetical protein
MGKQIAIGPDKEKFRELLNEFHKQRLDSPRDAAFAAQEIYGFFQFHYGDYIGSLLQRIEDLDKNSGLILSHLLEIQSKLNKLGEKEP